LTSDLPSIGSERRRLAEWTAVIASLVYALLFVRFQWGGAAAYILALLPCVLAYVVARTLLASAFMFLLPMYFVIGQWTASWPHYQPAIGLDRLMPLTPSWIGVYASLYFCAFLLPLVVVRSRELFRQAMKAYLFVMLVSYIGFVLYPTIAPHDGTIPVDGFATWSLQLFYDLDQPYGCFPSLHVAYSFVGALACYRMHRGVGIAAALWAAMIGISTVYTKQHFFVDAVVGAIEGVAAYAIFLRGSPQQQVDAVDRRSSPRRAVYVGAAYVGVVAIFWIAYQLGLGPVRG
jgi:membrane-associated phospholipid phosphatase